MLHRVGFDHRRVCSEWGGETEEDSPQPQLTVDVAKFTAHLAGRDSATERPPEGRGDG